MKYIFYCFSGTGNTLKVAQWMKETSLYETTIVMIGSKKKPVFSHDDCIGMFFPTHGFTAPWAVIRHAFRMPRSQGTRVFCAATRGMTKPGPFYLIGAELSANLVIAVILLMKGYRIQGMTAIDMPHNWTALFWGLHPKHVDYIFEKAEVKSKEFMKRILSGKKEICTLNNIIMMILGIVLLPVSFLYIALGRIILAKILFANGSCNGCGVCAKNCPAGGITLVGRKNIPYWNFSCESCMRCMNFCPKNAIEASHQILILYIISVYVPAAAFCDLLLSRIGLGSIITSAPFCFLIEYIAAIAGAFITYEIFWLLCRIPPVRALFAGTTLTHYYRKYKAKGIKLKDFSG